MDQKNIEFQITFNEIYLDQVDIFNANIKVFITLQNGFSLIVIVGTPRNFQYLMENGKVNFYGPGLPWIFV